MAHLGVEQTIHPKFGIVALATVYAGAAPGINTNILSTGVQVSPSASAIRVTVVLATSSVFNFTVTDGTTAYTVGLNASAALNAGDAYTFVFGARRYKSQPNGSVELTYNFQVETDGVINLLFVEEVAAPVI